MFEPTQVRAGDTISWTEVLADYPAPDWTLKYRLLGDTNSGAIAAVGTGTSHVVTIDNSTSKAFIPGTYTLVAWVEKTGGERHTISETTILVLSNPETGGSGGDTRSFIRRELALVEAAIEKWTGKPIELTIGGRSRRYESLNDLFAFRQVLKGELSREDAKERLAKGLKSGRAVRVTFGPPR